MTKLEHARTIKTGKTIFNAKEGLIVPIVSAWWKLDTNEEPSNLVAPMPAETARAIYGHPIAIQFDNVKDWQVLAAMSQIIGDARLLAVYNYLKLIDLERRVARVKTFGA